MGSNYRLSEDMRVVDAAGRPVTLAAIVSALNEAERLREAIREHHRRVLELRDEYGPPMVPLDAPDEALWAVVAGTRMSSEGRDA